MELPATRFGSREFHYHYPRHILHVHEHPRARYQNGVLCRFWVLAGCAPEGVAAPLGCVIFSVSVEIAACMPCAQCFPNVRDEGWYHYPRRALCAVETLGARLSK